MQQEEIGFLKSPLGVLKIGVLSQKVIFIKKIPLSSYKVTKSSFFMKKALKEFKEYFSHRRKVFHIPFRLEGTEFQQKVWKEITRIPFGKTLSYAEIARKVGSPKAFRAVGQACNKNPCPILVPCHRVLSSQKKLTGFALGVNKKKFLLSMEKNTIFEH